MGGSAGKCRMVESAGHVGLMEVLAWVVREPRNEQSGDALPVPDSLLQLPASQASVTGESPPSAPQFLLPFLLLLIFSFGSLSLGTTHSTLK